MPIEHTRHLDTHGAESAAVALVFPTSRVHLNLSFFLLSW